MESEDYRRAEELIAETRFRRVGLDWFGELRRVVDAAVYAFQSEQQGARTCYLCRVPLPEGLPTERLLCDECQKTPPSLRRRRDENE